MTPEVKLKTKQAFADSFSFYLQAHYYHWNVEGRHFGQDHGLFGTIYEEVHEALDAFAEKIRTLDTHAPGVFHRLEELSRIEQDSSIPSAEEMYERLINTNAQVIASLEQAYHSLEEAHIHGFANFIADRLDRHHKHQWMLRSTLK